MITISFALFSACEVIDTPPIDGGRAAQPDASVVFDAGVVDAGPSGVRLATFNVRRFFDTVCQTGSCTSSGDFEDQLTTAQFSARATQIATAIEGFDADLVALEEIENQTCLDALLARLSTTMPYGVIGEIGTAGSVDVAILSKTPIDRMVAHRALERLTRPDGSITSFSRELLEVEVRSTNGNLPIVFFAAHFRSKVSDDPGRRLAEAQVSRRVLETRAANSPNALVVLGGDLNDTPGSPPLDALTLDGGLYRVASDLPTAEQATYVFNGQGQAIDHLLQASTSAGVVVPRSARVWKNTNGFGFAGSDHFALTADFELR